MHRTTILLPPALHREAEIVARQRGITLSELIRRKLTAAVGAKATSARSRDPLFRPGRLIEGKGPTDMAVAHDHYLYGEIAKPRSRKTAR